MMSKISTTGMIRFFNKNNFSLKVCTVKGLITLISTEFFSIRIEGNVLSFIGLEKNDNVVRYMTKATNENLFEAIMLGFEMCLNYRHEKVIEITL